MPITSTIGTGAAFTICALNYMRKALVLRESFLRHNPGRRFLILLVERKNADIEAAFPGIDLMWAEDLDIEGFLRYAFMYDIIELSTNVKAVALKKLSGEFGKVLYLDPDIKVYSSLSGVYSELNEASIVVTPHTMTPVLDGWNPNDVDFSRFGSFNLGFIGIAGDAESIRFLDWWAARCLRLGFYEPQSGLAVDQKWVDLAPAFFPGLRIIRHRGMNVAFWNLHERSLTRVSGDWMVNGTDRLCFFHFSSFNEKDPLAIAHKQNRFEKGAREDVEPLLLDYADEMGKMRVPSVSMAYSFDYFATGEYITPLLRRIFAVMPESMKDRDPFAVDSAILEYGLRRGLAKRAFSPQARETFKDLDSHSLAIRVIDVLLACLLRLVGPFRYHAFLRYLAHVSSVRNQGSIFWKKGELNAKI
jgi:hypothetical protein